MYPNLEMYQKLQVIDKSDQVITPKYSQHGGTMEQHFAACFRCTVDTLIPNVTVAQAAFGFLDQLLKYPEMEGKLVKWGNLDILTKLLTIAQGPRGMKTKYTGGSTKTREKLNNPELEEKEIKFIECLQGISMPGIKSISYLPNTSPYALYQRNPSTLFYRTLKSLNDGSPKLEWGMDYKNKFIAQVKSAVRLTTSKDHIEKFSEKEKTRLLNHLNKIPAALEQEAPDAAVNEVLTALQNEFKEKPPHFLRWTLQPFNKAMSDYRAGQEEYNEQERYADFSSEIS